MQEDYAVSPTFLPIFLLHVLGYSFGIKHHILAQFGHILLPLKASELISESCKLQVKCFTALDNQRKDLKTGNWFEI
jgi:hypothetical protein